jgi:hypothetical protein
MAQLLRRRRLLDKLAAKSTPVQATESDAQAEVPASDVTVEEELV